MSKLDNLPDNCRECGLWEEAQSYKVDGRGNLHARVMFVGQNPGTQEDIKGECWVGDAGELLAQAIEVFEIGDAFLTNAVRCHRPGNVAPTKKHIRLCQPFLQEEIKKVNPRYIMALGGPALESLLGTASISSLVGRPRLLPGTDITVIPNWHPAYILRNPAEQEKLEEVFGQLSDLIKGKTADQIPTNYQHLTSAAQLDSMLTIYAEELIAFDFETTGLRPFSQKDFRVLSVAFSPEPGTGFSILVRHKDNPMDEPEIEEVEGIIRQWLVSKTRKIAHNIKYEVAVSRRVFGCWVRGIFGCTMLMDHHIDENLKHGLSDLSGRHTDMGGYDDIVESLLLEIEGETGRRDYELLPVDILREYSVGDTDCTIRLFHILQKLMTEEAWEYHSTVDLPLIKSLVSMEEFGLSIDEGGVREVNDELGRIKIGCLETLQQTDSVRELESRQSKEYNPISTPQTRKLLFELQGLATKERTKTGAMSTNKEVLRDLEHQWGPAIEIYNYRSASSLISQFVKPMGIVEPYDGDCWLDTPDGRAHTTFTMYKLTKRTGSQEPHFHNIPRDSTSVVRKMFIPSNDVFLDLDLSQAELRVFGIYTQDETFKRVFEEKLDIHSIIAGVLLNKDSKEIDDKERQQGKRLAFAIANRKSVQTTAREWGVTESHTEDIFQKVFSFCPQLMIWWEANDAFLKKNGYIENYFGVRRNLPNAQLDGQGNYYDMLEALRQGTNFQIQSTAFGIMSWIINLVRMEMEERKLKSRLVLQVHDNLTTDVVGEEVEEVFDTQRVIVESIHEMFPWMTIPMMPEISIGPNLHDMEKIYPRPQEV